MSATYNLRSLPNGWQVNKFDDDFNLESSYEMTQSDGEIRCDCPAGARPTCRHRQMFAELLTRLDTAWMLDFDTKQWVDPTGQAIVHEIEEITGTASAASSSACDCLTEDECDNRKGCQVDACEAARVAVPQRTVHEEQSPPEPITRVDDSHPFRRRM